MRKPFNYLILFFLSTPVFSQNFSGEIIYEEFECDANESYESKLGNKENTSASKYLISSFSYKFSKYENDTFKLSYTYNPKTKDLVDEEAGQPYLTYRSSLKSYSNPKKVTVLEDSTISIHGYTCYPVIMEYDKKITTSYFSNEVRIRFNLFKEHKLGYWYEKLKLTNGGISLRTITQFDDKISVSNAISVTKRKVKKKELKIPKTKRLVASGYDLDTPPKLSQPNEEQIKCYREKLLYGQSLVDREITSIVSFILTKTGEKEHVRCIDSKSKTLDNVTLDILNNCGLTIIPGQMNEEYVDSKYYFPVKYSPLVKK